MMRHGQSLSGQSLQRVITQALAIAGLSALVGWQTASAQTGPLSQTGPPAQANSPGQTGPGGDAASGNSPSYYTDPSTGIVYQKVHRTVERPVVTTEMTTQESTVYRPDTVVDVTPETRTLYTPVVSYNWEPRWRGRWNPFVHPTLHYEPVARTHWEARSETVQRRQTRTQWVAEQRRVEVPRQVMRIEREEKVDYLAVGRVAPPGNQPSASDAANAALAARLRPIDAGTAITPFGATGGGSAVSSGYGLQSVASTTLPLAPAGRSSDQTGIRATQLQPQGNAAHVTPLPPVGVARGPLQPWWR